MNIKITPKKPEPVPVNIRKIVIIEKSASQSNYCEIQYFDARGKEVQTEDADDFQDAAQRIFNRSR